MSEVDLETLSSGKELKVLGKFILDKEILGVQLSSKYMKELASRMGVNLLIVNLLMDRFTMCHSELIIMGLNCK